MASNSKILHFFILFAFAMSLSSCKKSKNDVIPDVYVDFVIDLYDPEFVNLNSPTNSDTIDARTNNWGVKSAGYNGNGIIVYCVSDGEFYAYDRTCPHDFEVNNINAKVKIDFTLGICPKCGTSYALAASGTPVSGKGRYPLKNYKTYFDGRYLRVWNNF